MALSLIPGFSQMRDTACGAACIATSMACIVCAYKYRNRIPHITEISCIGNLYLKTGLHDHGNYESVIEVTESKGLMPACYDLVIKAGRFEHTVTSSEKGEFYQICNLFIPQCAEKIQFTLYPHKILNRDSVGEFEIAINEKFLKSPPEKKFYSLLDNNNRPTGQLEISVTTTAVTYHQEKTNPNNAENFLSLVLSHSKRRMRIKNSLQLYDKEYAALAILDKMRYISFGCEGFLEQMNSFGKWKKVYLRLYQKNSKSKWSMEIIKVKKWKDEMTDENYLQGIEEKIDVKKNLSMTIPCLHIVAVLVHQEDPNIFLLRYRTANHLDAELTFRKIKTSRDIWVNSLFTFRSLYQEAMEMKKKKTTEKVESVEGSKIPDFFKHEKNEIEVLNSSLESVTVKPSPEKQRTKKKIEAASETEDEELKKLLFDLEKDA